MTESGKKEIDVSGGMEKYKVCTVLDITQPLLAHNEKSTPEVLKLIVQNKEGGLEVKYLETEGFPPLGRGSIIVSKPDKIITMKDVHVVHGTKYVPDMAMISSLLATIQTQRKSQT
ncbi:hypothetical protein NECID01_0385 [Nematocida sp. AWRm77]|nr:hypothetical protein NECID01_0385 [Nematocida sp. AWRm77]